MKEWKIYYASGGTRSWKQGLPDEITEEPLFFGIQAILQDTGDKFNKRYHIIKGHDFYILDISGYWIPVDRDSIIRRLMFHRHEIDCVLQGLCITQPRFREISDQAILDKDKASLD